MSKPITQPIFGWALEDTRLQLDWSRRRMAEFLGIDPATVWRWERAKMPPQTPGPATGMVIRLFSLASSGKFAQIQKAERCTRWPARLAILFRGWKPGDDLL